MNGFLIDLHCHTLEHSFDGQVPAETIVRTLVERGFHGVVFTDHYTTWQDDELAELRAKCGVGEEFLLLAGQEVRTSVVGARGGDMLLYGPKVNVPDGTDANEVIRLAKESGGFCTAAHPAIPGIGLGEQVGDYPLAGIEIWNGRYGAKAAKAAEALANKYMLNGVGGSDTHRPDDIGGGGTLFPEMPRTLADIGRLIRAGECAPWRPSAPKRLLKWFAKEE